MEFSIKTSIKCCFAATLALSAFSASARTPPEAYQDCIEARTQKYYATPGQIRDISEAIYGSCIAEAERAFMVAQNEPIIGGKRAVLSDRSWDADVEARHSVESEREILRIMGTVLLLRRP